MISAKTIYSQQDLIWHFDCNQPSMPNEDKIVIFKNEKLRKICYLCWLKILLDSVLAKSIISLYGFPKICRKFIEVFRFIWKIIEVGLRLSFLTFPFTKSEDGIYDCVMSKYFQFLNIFNIGLKRP